ncbi:hypothetical protein F5Y15DRAFT_103363 [Xylariaceae sp. FL0016]|nr:hypothetical protein F5Y15DRAFT_103363 [Xylariaceae sp. FL0016]
MTRPTHFAASNEPLHIFQDYHDDYSISRAPMPSVGKQPPPRQALQSSNGNVVFNPPRAHGKQHSPYKHTGRPVASNLNPLRSSHAGNLNAVSILPPNMSGQTTDSMQKKQPLMSKFKTVAQKPPTMDQYSNFEKENVHPAAMYPAPPAFNLDDYYQKSTGKRALLEPAPITDSRPSKKVKAEEPSLPAPNSFPQIHDDGAKPGHSYAQLIGMAILRAPNRRLTLSQIYKWISDTYSFYGANDAGWQNSIRHNLSLNKAFIKQERPKDDPGKGNYWAIEPGMEQQFMKEKPSRKSTTAAENVHVMSMPPRVDYAQLESTTYHDGLPSLPPVLPPQQTSYVQTPMLSQASMHKVQEVSSDATIPLSDNGGSEEPSDKVHEQDATLDSMYSQLPAEMHSSPPMPRHLEHRSNTPPPIMRESRSSASRKRTHKRKHVSMDATASFDDSGYISSLESSAMRPTQSGRIHSSGADRPRIKRGRAEEEIARLRASSYDSPTKSRSYGLVPPSSSPLRQSNDGQMLPPLTPAVKMRPNKPPPSVSPSTNLRIHRDNVRHMLNSPLRRVSNVSENYATMTWSPAFLPDAERDCLFNLHDFAGDRPFSIFTDENDEFDFDAYFAAENGSPVKRPAKRTRVERTQSSSALGEITSATMNKSATPVPSLKAPPSFYYESPSKVFEGMSSPSKLFIQSPLVTGKTTGVTVDDNSWMKFDDFCATDFLDEDAEASGMDILQGFEKIGGGQNPAASSKSLKPALGRSHTSKF